MEHYVNANYDAATTGECLIRASPAALLPLLLVLRRCCRRSFKPCMPGSSKLRRWLVCAPP